MEERATGSFGRTFCSVWRETRGGCFSEETATGSSTSETASETGGGEGSETATWNADRNAFSIIRHVCSFRISEET